MGFMDVRVVIVTGASRGLGRVIALQFGSRGDRVVVNYLKSETEAGAAAEAIRHSGGEAFTVRADVRESGDVDRLISATMERWGRVDVLVNNAGLSEDGLCIRLPEDAWKDVLTTNLKGPFLCIRAAAKVMMKQRSGHIINISSIVGVQGRPGQANYAASKAGLIGLTKAASRELGLYDIKVNAVLPGYLSTDMGEGVSDDYRQRILDENTLGRAADPTEVAGFIAYLTSMDNVSGQVFNLDSRVI